MIVIRMITVIMISSISIWRARIMSMTRTYDCIVTVVYVDGVVVAISNVVIVTSARIGRLV
jgi:hypothetical protein